MSQEILDQRVDRLEIALDRFIDEASMLNRIADQRNKTAEERFAAFQKVADQRNSIAEERFAAFQKEMRALSNAADERMTRFELESKQFKREMDKKWGDLANKLGTIIEDILAPNLKRLAVEYFGFKEVTSHMIRCYRKLPGSGDGAEFDTIVTGLGIVLLGEAKSSPTLEHVEQFGVKIQTFNDYFPEYRDLKLISVFGSWAIKSALVNRLTDLGIYAMQMGEDTMELTNAGELDVKNSIAHP